MNTLTQNEYNNILDIIQTVYNMRATALYERAKKENIPLPEYESLRQREMLHVEIIKECMKKKFIIIKD